MKKKIKYLLPITTFALLGIAISNASVAKPVNASINSRTAIEDNFNKDEFKKSSNKACKYNTKYLFKN